MKNFNLKEQKDILIEDEFTFSITGEDKYFAKITISDTDSFNLFELAKGFDKLKNKDFENTDLKNDVTNFINDVLDIVDENNVTVEITDPKVNFLLFKIISQEYLKEIKSQSSSSSNGVVRNI